MVARPTTWGNPFTLKMVRELGLAGTDDDARAVSVELYRSWIAGSDAYWSSTAESKAKRTEVLRDAPERLRGHDLGCWCPLEGDCHADVLLELANTK